MKLVVAFLNKLLSTTLGQAIFGVALAKKQATLCRIIMDAVPGSESPKDMGILQEVSYGCEFETGNSA